MSTPLDITVVNSVHPAPSGNGAPVNGNPLDAATDAPPPHWFTFPPFPAPPPGVTVTPFKTFKPSGIVVVQNPPPDYIERDGLGIPTVPLRVKHSLTEGEQRKKKRNKTVTRPDGTVRRATWWEEWETGEDARKMTALVNPSDSRVDRLHQASQDFKSCRPWPALPSVVPQLWDAFRLYVGIISSVNPPVSRKTLQTMQAQNVSDDDDDDDEDADDPKVKESQAAVTDEEKERAHELGDNFLEAKDLHMDNFLNDTEKNIKIFFSSHFRDKGLIWSEQRVREGPILIGFFLGFLLRNRVFPEPEQEKGLRRALQVIQLARKELPATFIIGKALPDSLGVGCEKLFGSMAEIACINIDFGDNTQADVTEDQEDEGEPETKRRKVEEKEEDRALKEAIGEVDAEVITPEVIESLGKAVQQEREAADADSDGTGALAWGNASADSGWGTGGWGAGNASSEPPDPWAQPGSTWEIIIEPNPIMAFLGPTIFPLTHTTGVAERSTRRILSLIPVQAASPAPGKAARKKAKQRAGGMSDAEKVEEELCARLVRATLAPWGDWERHTGSDIMRPSVLSRSRGPFITEADQSEDKMDSENGAKPHDPFKDEITVLFEPAVAEKLIIGMGLAGTWVQLARQDLSAGSWTDKNAAGKQQRDEKGEFGVPTKLWYMEHLASIIPSYHTEP
ncbi:uncharacterized protein LAESUDRAFT_681115 [Laetiporus sulphureus 93-53]|uniref:Uncharacterized protein n=1 Tax=Laetiporus sulphureus 93-53 TaxID=1314785 RepID=A0A165DTG4_9APHY|nr:uncharacterized protein LAESUDRAFT_681115 [Laetiporus sulphureus 93-53]KZT05598.1 hypothetical protein LAESUDRAFT_681115 [Laetiporus sulphureus 93-53]